MTGALRKEKSVLLDDAEFCEDMWNDAGRQAPNIVAPVVPTPNEDFQ
jgi:hypothetical protein